MNNPTLTTEKNCASAPLAIIGIGCLFPQADNATAYWANIREGLDAITEIPATHWRPEDYFNPDQKAPDHTYGRRGGFISPQQFNPLEFNIPPNTLEAIDTSQLLGLVAAGQALKDAGYGPEREYDRNRVSVVLGVTGTLELVIPLGARLGHPIWRQALKDAGVDDTTAADVVERIADGYVPWQENSFPGLLGNVVAGRISKQFDLGGTNCVVDAACASSFSALHLASLELAAGKSDMVVTGGIDTFNDIFMYMCFSKTPALSPTGNAKPFDASGDGTILGEGLGIVVIKRLADAERDGDRIYAVIRGVGSSSDGKGDAIYAPSASGQKKALLNAYAQASVTPESIGMIEAHGTGTKVGDAVEVSALREVYGAADHPWCALGSVKAQIGHTKAAAGAAGLIKAALALHHKVIPPTIKVTNPLAEVTSGQTPFYLATTKRPWLSNGATPRRAAVSAFGFGGSNFHTVLEEYQAEKVTADWDGTVQLLTFSAASTDELASQLDGLSADLAWPELRSRAAASRASFRASASCRLALVVEQQTTNLATLLNNARTQLRTNQATAWQTPDGVFFSSAQAAPSAALFPGQGAQYTGMLRDLACSFPEVFSTLATADAGFGTPAGIRLSDYLYPPAAFAPTDKAQQEEQLRATDVAQPAIGAVSLGALRLLQSFGFAPVATAGHSYGELTALCAAGRLDEASFHQLSRLRGQLMAAGSGDKGSMLAVPAPLATVEQILAEEKLDLVLANRNAPTQAVLSGATNEIERAIAIFTARKLTCKQLPVAAAFHSRLVADAAAPFLTALDPMHLAEATMPVYANTTAAPYPTDPVAAKELLANQLAKPVEFVAEIEALYASGCRTFMEIGPGARLTGLVKAILGDRDHTALALDASSGKRSGIADLARTLAQLAVLGHELQLSAWDGNYQPAPANSKKPLMTVSLSGANYVKPREKRPPVAAESKNIVPGAPLMGQPTPQIAAPVIMTSPTAMADTLRVTRDSIAVLQKMQEETAQLHRRFLEGQELASRTLQTLLSQQQQLLSGGMPTLSFPTVSTIAAPQPMAIIQTPVMPVLAAQQPAPAAPPVQTVAPTDSPVTATLLAVVSEKTGYPQEMLDPSMSLDADLGIDSIKRVEILSALQERLPGAPIIGPEQLGSLQTLGEIAAFLGAGSTVGAPLAATQTFNAIQGAANSAPTEQNSNVTTILLAVVSEKTGYPQEMLDPGMSLDADLGIDSIKRVEILSTLQERLPGAPVIGPEQLGSLQTLGEIAAFLGAGTEPATITNSQPTSSMVNSSPVTSTLVTDVLLTVVSEKTGYPTEMLELTMSLDADLGIDSIKRVEILSALQERLPGAPIIGPEQLGTLQTLGEIAAFLGQAAPAAPAAVEPAAETRPVVPPAPPAASIRRSGLVAQPLPAAPTNAKLALAPGEVWLTDDSSPFVAALYAALHEGGLTVRLIPTAEQAKIVVPETLAGLVLIAPAAGTDDKAIVQAFALLQRTAPALRRAGEAGGALFATVSRLDGAFGCGTDTQLADPLSGGLAGLAKTASREWPEVICRALDLGEFPDAVTAADALAAELRSNVPLEVGLSPAGRTGLVMAELSPARTAVEPPFTAGDLVIITGGGRGVTAATAIALAESYRPFLVLLGRSPEPATEPEWLAPLVDESKIKRALLDHAGKKLHPKEIEERYQEVIAGRELRATLERITTVGGKAIYRPIDIRNATAVAILLADLRRQHGPIRGIIHGAGVLADRLIIDKTREQFAQVYDTKVAGLRSLLTATTDDELRVLALFSSTTGRFGRTGQVDYAVGNEVLNKLAQVEARQRSNCRVVSINWGPWDGGMVTPTLKKVFAGEGIGLIGLEAGGTFLVNEIGASDAPVEIIAIAEASGAVINREATLTKAFERTLTIEDHPFLRSHVLDGHAVLPMAMIIEWFAHGALHGNPGLRFHGFNELRICKGVIFDQQQPSTLQVLAGRAEKRETFYIVPMELQSIGQDGRITLNARADIVLTGKLPVGIRSITDVPTTPYEPPHGTIYHRERLFHGPDLHGIQEVEGCSAKGIAALVKRAPAPTSWIKQPLRSNWLTDPLAIDSAFQLMILWSFQRTGAGSLPTFAGRYRQFSETFPKDGVQIVIKVTSQREHGATADMEFLDRTSGKLVARLEDYECVIDPSLAKAFQRNKLQQVGAA